MSSLTYHRENDFSRFFFVFPVFRLRRSIAEGSGRGEANALVGQFVTKDGSPSMLLRLSDENLRGFANAAAN